MIAEETKSIIESINTISQPPTLAQSEFQKLKLVIVGPPGSGKTSIIHQFVGKQFNHDVKSTNCYEVHNKHFNLEGKEVELKIWDCSVYHHQSYLSVIKAFYKGAYCVIVVVDLQNCDCKQLEAQINEWTEECMTNDQYNIIIIGNKLDLLLDSDRQQSFEEDPPYHDGSQGSDIQLTQQESNFQIAENQKIINHEEVQKLKAEIEQKGIRIFLGSCRRSVGNSLPYQQILIGLIKEISKPTDSYRQESQNIMLRTQFRAKQLHISHSDDNNRQSQEIVVVQPEKEKISKCQIM